MKNRKLNAILTAVALFSSVVITAAYAADPAATNQSAAELGGVVDDTTITGKVKAAISADRQVSALKIEVNTKQGVVVLSGTVPNAGVSDHVLQLVASIEGVRDVKNQLKISSTS